MIVDQIIAGFSFYNSAKHLKNNNYLKPAKHFCDIIIYTCTNNVLNCADTVSIGVIFNCALQN